MPRTAGGTITMALRLLNGAEALAQIRHDLLDLQALLLTHLGVISSTQKIAAALEALVKVAPDRPA